MQAECHVLKTIQIWWQGVVLLTEWGNERTADYRTNYDENYKGMTWDEEFFRRQKLAATAWTKGNFRMRIMSAESSKWAFSRIQTILIQVLYFYIYKINELNHSLREILRIQVGKLAWVKQNLNTSVWLGAMLGTMQEMEQRRRRWPMATKS